MEIVGSLGAVRTWWSGVMDRTLEPRHERLIGESALHTISLLADVLLDVIEGTDPVSP